mgnify:CR=1 FL=1
MLSLLCLIINLVSFNFNTTKLTFQTGGKQASQKDGYSFRLSNRILLILDFEINL